MRFSNILVDNMKQNLKELRNEKDNKVRESRRFRRSRFNSVNESEMNNETESALMILRNEKDLYNFARSVAIENRYDIVKVSNELEDCFEEELEKIVNKLENEGVELLLKQLASDAINRIDWVAVARDFCED